MQQLLTLHSLNQQDRDLLKSAGSKVGTHAMVGSLAGLGLGVYCAFRLRAMRLAYFRAFRTMEKPVEVRFADGRTGAYKPPFPPAGASVPRLNPRRTYPRHLGTAFALEMGGCRKLLLFLGWRAVPGRRDWRADRHGVGVPKHYPGPSGAGADREGVQELPGGRAKTRDQSARGQVVV
jgi:hypothetical protein